MTWGISCSRRGAGVVIGEVLDVRPHPNGDRIFLAQVDTGVGVPSQIVFGGIRLLTAGDKVAVALPGARLPDGEKIRPRRYRGVRSSGELLSSDELGWTNDGPDAVMVFDSSFPVGLPISPAYRVFGIRNGLSETSQAS
jgi:tRNA-binding EMAP/Myf-like protein